MEASRLSAPVGSPPYRYCRGACLIAPHLPSTGPLLAPEPLERKTAAAVKVQQ